MLVLKPKFVLHPKTGQELVPVIVQDSQTGEVLMEAHANMEAYLNTLTKGLATFWSRSRNKLWVKGEESGNLMRLDGLPRIDCDGDSLIYRVKPDGPACHTNQRTCFYRSVSDVGMAEFPSKKEELEIMEVEIDL